MYTKMSKTLSAKYYQERRKISESFWSRKKALISLWTLQKIWVRYEYYYRTKL